MFTLLLTCPYGLASVLNQELKYLKYKPFDSYDMGTFVQTDRQGLIHLNLRSRVASKIYVEIGQADSCTSFEELYTLSDHLPREQWLPQTEFLSINVHTYQSKLYAPRSIQSIVHKAILTHLQAKGEDSQQSVPSPYEIFCRLDHDQVRRYLNTSGPGLHQRGYRLEAGEAPLKENVAAALVLMSGRRRQDILRDPCCGAGTVCIEGAMIARNIAPGLQRSFAFQQFVTYPADLFLVQHQEAKEKGFTKSYQIFGSDIDSDVLSKARRNAERAGVADTITFSHHDLLVDTLPSFIDAAPTHLHLITNPPYGKRLTPPDLSQLYKKLIVVSNNPTTHLTLISSYPDFSELLGMRRPRRETANGPDRCHIRQKPIG